MAKKKNKKKYIINGKDVRKLSVKDLNKRLTKINKRIEAAEKSGDDATLKKLKKRRKTLNSVVEKKGGKKITDTFTGSLDDIYASEEFGLLSPKQQEAFKAAVDLYDPGSLPEQLTDEELNLIAQEAAAAVDPYYNQLEQDITQDYEQQLFRDLDTTQDNIQQAKEDLQVALNRNDRYAAQQIKEQLNQLQTSLPQMQEDLQAYVDYKQDYLERNLGYAEEEMTTKLGELDEDEVLALRSAERSYMNKLEDLKESMVSRGYAFSSKRLKEEEEAGEEQADIVTGLKSTYERQRQEAEKRYEQYKEGLQAQTAYDIASQESQTQASILNALLKSESSLGTQRTQDLIAQLGLTGMEEYLAGSTPGSIKASRIQEAVDRQKAFERLAGGQVSDFESLYGTDYARSKFGQYGQYTQGDLIGSRQRAKEREERATAYERASAKQSMEDLLTEQRTLGTYL